MKSNQRGGIVSFVAVSLALVGLLAGGLYLSKTQARDVRGSAAAPQTVSQKPQDETKTENKPKEDGAAESTKPKEQPAGGTSTPENPATLPGNRVANTGPTGEIPATGPADTALYALGFGSLTFTGYHLVRSRRSLRHSALKH